MVASSRRFFPERTASHDRFQGSRVLVPQVGDRHQPPPSGEPEAPREERGPHQRAHGNTQGEAAVGQHRGLRPRGAHPRRPTPPRRDHRADGRHPRPHHRRGRPAAQGGRLQRGHRSPDRLAPTRRVTHPRQTPVTLRKEISHLVSSRVSVYPKRKPCVNTVFFLVAPRGVEPLFRG